MRVYIIILTAIILSGCISSKPPATYTFEHERIYTKPFDSVWVKTIEWFAIDSITITNLDKSSGVISSDLDLGADKIMACLDCGTGKSNGYVREDFENARGNFNVVIKKIDSLNTKVLVSSSFHATKKTTDVTNPFLATKKTNDVTNPILPPKLMPYNSTIQSDTVECNSTGVLEKQLLKYLGRQ